LKKEPAVSNGYPFDIWQGGIPSPVDPLKSRKIRFHLMTAYALISVISRAFLVFGKRTVGNSSRYQHLGKNLWAHVEKWRAVRCVHRVMALQQKTRQPVPLLPAHSLAENGIFSAKEVAINPKIEGP